MAEFPIEYAETLPSGRAPAVRAGIDVSTGAEAIAQSIQALGAAFMKIADAQNAMEFSTMKRQFDELSYDFINASKTAVTEEAQQALTKQYDIDRAAIQSKSKRVNNLFLKFQNQRLPIVGNTIANIKLAMHAKWVDDNFAINLQKLMETGATEDAATLIMKYSKVRPLKMSQALAEEMIENLPVDITFVQARIAMDTNPQAVIDMLSDPEFREKLDGEQLDKADILSAKAGRIIKAQIEEKQEADRDILGDALERLSLEEENPITYEMIDNTSIPEKEQMTWRSRMKTELESLRDPDTDWLIYDSLDTAIKNYQLAPDPAKKQELLERARVERFDNRSLSNVEYKTIKNALEKDLSSEDAYWLREARNLLDEAIRERDKLSGMLRTEEGLMAAAAIAKMTLDKAMDEAVKEGKPLRGRDILIRAMQMVPIFKVKKEKEEEWPSVESIGRGLKEIDISWKEPETLESFYRTVQMINQKDGEDDARVYYEQFVDKFTK